MANVKQSYRNLSNYEEKTFFRFQLILNSLLFKLKTNATLIKNQTGLLNRPAEPARPVHGVFVLFRGFKTIAR
jgi:hypothetical protein